jgi:hypothetical protein
LILSYGQFQIEISSLLHVYLTIAAGFFFHLLHHHQVLQRSVQMQIMKKDQEQEEFWPRLLKDKVLEKTNVKIDWDKYVDEDEETEGFDTSNLDGGSGFGGGGMPPGMGGMGGMPGMGGELYFLTCYRRRRRRRRRRRCRHTQI